MTINRLLIVLFLFTGSIGRLTATAEDIELLATLKVAGDARDASGISGEFDNGIPKNQFGGFSAIAYTGDGDRYLVLSDRGPDDGAVPYGCRYHEVTLAVDEASGQSQFKLLKTFFLRRPSGMFSGSAAEWATTDGLANRLDAEGLRVEPSGNLLISEEYGPAIFRFDPSGLLIESLPVPSVFRIRNPGLTKQDENADNDRGRQGNGGLEGLALSADGKIATAILQGPLLQDHAFDSAGEDLGKFVRILQTDLQSGMQRQFVYPLENPGFGVSEILDLGPETFLVLERDSKAGLKSDCKAIYKINCVRATDVTGIDSLAANRLPAAVHPVAKELFLDLRDEQLGLTDRLPKKIEGLAWGPSLKDGRRLLVVCSDNDFETDQSSEFYFFAVR